MDPTQFLSPDAAIRFSTSSGTSLEQVVEEFCDIQDTSNKAWIEENANTTIQLPKHPWKYTNPPAPAQVRDAYLSQLKTAVNSSTKFPDLHVPVLEIPTDYRALLSISDGIKDIDLRSDGVIHINQICDQAIHDISGLAERLPGARFQMSRDWDFAAGFTLGAKPARQDECLTYFYCARTGRTNPLLIKRLPRPIYPSEQLQWKWRLFYCEKERFGLMFQAGEAMVFDGIASWLVWYGDWYYRYKVVIPRWLDESRRNAERMCMLEEEESSNDDDICYTDDDG